MFTLSIPLTVSGLNAIKHELTQVMPSVKSSHRCEAIARGLDFHTYASARAATKAKTVTSIDVRGDLFKSYLADRGFDASSKTLYHAAAKVALRHVSEQTPRLTLWGIGVGQPRRKADGKWQNSQDMAVKFRREKRELLEDDAIPPFLASLAFVQRVKPTKTIRPSTGSYWLKHIAENFVCTYPEGDELGPVYVPNGAFIAAALHQGFWIKSHVDDLGWDGPNVDFNMSKPCLEDLDCEIRPDGARARDREWRKRSS